MDPNATSAWNALLWGAKKWVLYPPGAVPPGVHPSPDGADVATPVSLTEWFVNFYAATRETKVGRRGDAGPGEGWQRVQRRACLIIGLREQCRAATPAGRGRGLKWEQSLLPITHCARAVAKHPCGVVLITCLAPPAALQVRPVECVARPGELLFVPRGWWHCALNLEVGVGHGNGIGCGHHCGGFFTVEGERQTAAVRGGIKAWVMEGLARSALSL